MMLTRRLIDQLVAVELQTATCLKVYVDRAIVKAQELNKAQDKIAGKPAPAS